MDELSDKHFLFQAGQGEGDLKFFKLDERIPTDYGELEDKEAGVTFTVLSSSRQVSSIVYSMREPGDEEKENNQHYPNEDVSPFKVLSCGCFRLFAKMRDFINGLVTESTF